jgi:methionyl-tRNA formyltransferase
LKIVFAGTPEFAAAALQAILAAGHQVTLVLTQPDRPSGRGMQVQASAVKKVAMAHGLPLYQPEKLRDPASHQILHELAAGGAADLMVVAAYGLILPQAVLDIPRLGCVNIHASLLPRWRGAAPIQRAIEAGDSETGITIMRVEAGLDTGAMLLTGSLPIAATDNAATLHDKLAILGAELIVSAIARLPTLTPTPQPEEGVTYAAKIGKAEALLDWRRSAVELERAVRAFDPFPGAVGQLNGASIKIWRAQLVTDNGPPGTVLSAGPEGIIVACGEGAMALQTLQQPGSKRMPAADFLRGFSVRAGDAFTIPAALAENAFHA